MAKGIGAAAAGVGAVFLFGAIKGVSVAQALAFVVSGKNPAKLPPTYPIDIPANATAQNFTGGLSGPGASPTGNAIADTALKYNGKVMYKWAGGSPAGWDCSGFVNYVLGHDLGMTLPGGVKNFDGSSHGPVVGQYLFWNRAHRIPRSEVAAGDIITYGIGIVPISHMGIAVSNSQIINAYSNGHLTEILPLDSAGPQPIICLRII